MNIKNIVAISDTHFGCKLALCPDKFQLDEGGYYTPSKLQKVVNSYWKQFWQWVAKSTKGEDFVVVHNGDSLDGIHHNSVTQITQNIDDQKRIAYGMMNPVLSNPKCKGYFHIRGTEAHAGKSGQDEETIARLLKAIPDENGNHARWELWLKFGTKNILCHFSHHVGTTNSTAYESTAVYKELVEAYNEAGRWKQQPPDVIVRSHRHRFFKTEVASSNTNAIAVVTPAWQLKTPFVYRGVLGRSSTPQIGGIIIREGDEVPVYVRQCIWNIGRSKEVVI
jgi:hypothetical protein